MKWVVNDNKYFPRSYEIESSAEGFYFYVYENGIDTHDYLQGSLEIAMKQALEDFGVPLNSWVQVE